MSRLRKSLDGAVAAAATLTGKRFGLLVASSVVATSAIVASAMTGTGDSGALAALLGRSLAAGNAPVASGPPPESSASPGSGTGSPAAPRESASAQPSSAPPASPAPVASKPESVPRSEPSAPLPALPEAGRIKHVFIVSLTSPGYEATFGEAPQMPYLATQLRPMGELLSGYTLRDDAALANGIATVSGQPPNASTEADCSIYTEFPSSAKVDDKGVVSGAGCVYPVETLTISDQLASGRFSWRGYIEGMVDETGKPDNCVHPEADATDAPAPGGYSAAQNPFVHFHSLLDLGDCATNDVPLEQLQVDLRKAGETPNYSYITPTPCDSGTSGGCASGSVEGAAAADSFLARWVPQVLASAAYKKDGLLIVTFGAAGMPTAEAAPAPAPAGDPLHVGALLVSPFVSGGSTDATTFDPYSLLRSTEDLFGLEHLGLATGAKVKSFASDLLGKRVATSAPGDVPVVSRPYGRLTTGTSVSGWGGGGADMTGPTMQVTAKVD